MVEDMTPYKHSRPSQDLSKTFEETVLALNEILGLSFGDA